MLFRLRGRAAAAAVVSIVSLLGAASAQPARQPEYHGRYTAFQPVSPDGKFSVRWTAQAEEGGRVLRLVEARSGTLLRELRGHSERPSEVVFGPDGKTLASWSHQGELVLWDAANGTVRLLLKNRHPDFEWYPVTYSPDGKLLAVAGINPQPQLKDRRSGAYGVWLWDTATGASRGVLKTGTDERPESVVRLFFLPDGKRLATGYGFSTQVWDLKTRKPERTIPVRALAFSPDGRWIAGQGLPDTGVELWDLRSGKRERVLSGHTMPVHRVHFTPDSRTFVSVGAKTELQGDVGYPKFEARVWDTATGKPLWSRRDESGFGYVLFTPDSTGLYLQDRRTLHDARSGAVKRELTSLDPLRVLLGPRGEVTETAAL